MSILRQIATVPVLSTPKTISPLLGCRRSSTDCRAAFSLLELLTVIVVIAILGTIIINGVSRVHKKAEQVKGLASLRQVMTLVMIYASEHDNRPPGPGARAQYSVLRRNEETQLSWLLRDYLNVQPTMLSGTPLPAITPPRLQALYDPSVTVAYFAVNNIHLPSGILKPWGTPPADYKDWTTEWDKQAKPLSEIPDAGRYVALIDLDLKLQAAGGGPVAVFNVMPDPLYGDSRNAAFWDGHVEVVPLDYNIFQGAN